MPGDPCALDALRAALRRIEDRRAAPGGGGGGAALGVAGLDAHLPPSGLAVGGLHEVAASCPGAAVAFSAFLCARLAAGGGAVLWCEDGGALDTGGLYAPGLRRFGLDPARLIVARTGRCAETLWAMEQGLRCAAVAAVVGAVRRASLTRTRRLHLAAERGGAAALMLRPDAADPAPSAAAARWRVSSAPAAGAAPRWRLELLRCRGGRPGTWEVEWRDETGALALAAPLRDRPAAPARLRAAG